LNEIKRWKKKKKHIGIIRAREGIGCVLQPAGQVKGKK
jgi:hypothetical protein